MGNEENIVQFIADNFPKMGGWCDPKKGLEIAKLVLETKPQRIAEVGAGLAHGAGLRRSSLERSAGHDVVRLAARRQHHRRHHRRTK